MPLISIIVPIYKVEKYIHRCVDSILTQTFTDFELILIDDGSPDNSGKICDAYSEMDDRIIVIHQCNGGVSVARNSGLAIAKGKYVLFIDSDDYVESDYLEQLMKQKSDLNVCGLITQNESGGVLWELQHEAALHRKQNTINYAKLYENNVLYSPYCKLFVNDIIQSHNLRFNEYVTWGEDAMFVADYLQYIESIAVSDYLGYHYIKYSSQESLSTKVREDIIDMISFSRLYCAEKMLITSPNCYDLVKNVCVVDIKKNMSYFVRKLLEHTELSLEQKTRILETYMDNEYLIDTFKNSSIYYSNSKKYCRALKKSDASAIIHSFYVESKIESTYLWVYKLYEKLPESFKNVYRYLKKVRR